MNGLLPMIVLRKSSVRSWIGVLWLAGCGLVTALLAGCGSPVAGEAARPAPPPAPSVRFEPASGTTGISPTAPLSASVTDGRMTAAVMKNEQGKIVAGEISPDGARWTLQEPLGYDKQYTLEVTAQGAGPPVTRRATFRTVAPKDQTYVSMNPTDGQTVGVGQPLTFHFSENAPPPDKTRAEEAIRIRTEPAVEGAFYWYDDREVHWRPKDHWKPGTRVTVDADVYGKDLGNGVYGEADRSATVDIGDAVVLRADGAKHEMSIEVNGVVRRTIPVSLGKPSAPSSNGTHVVTEKHENYLMDSSTFGLPVDAEGGYKIDVKWAVRISNGGEFLHAAPWSVGDQGRRNVSHGCINMSDADAREVFGLLKKGDIVEITNSGGPDLKPTDGFGDWQVPWQEWLGGNR